MSSDFYVLNIGDSDYANKKNSKFLKKEGHIGHNVVLDVQKYGTSLIIGLFNQG